MPIDPREVQWDTPANTGGIVWDDEKPAAPSAARSLPLITSLRSGGAFGDAAASIASSAVAAPISGFAGLMGAMLPGPPGQGADWVHKTGDALTYQPRTSVGQGIVSAVGYPGAKLAEWGDAAGGAISDKFGPVAGTAINTGIQALPMLAGAGLSKIAPGGETAGMLARRQAEAASRVQTDAALLNAKEAGLPVPPTQANPTFFNKMLEGAAGKIKTAQTISEKAQPRINQLVREEFRMSDETPISIDTMGQIRKSAGAAYEPVRESGRVAASGAYNEALDSIVAPYKNAAKDFPKAAKSEVIDAVDSVRVKSFDANSAVDQIQIIRDKADVAYRAGDKSLGGSYKSIANALEAELERHLDFIGAPADVIQNFRDARQTIAKTYTVQKHIRPNGNIDAAGIARELDRKPLTGNLKTIGEFARNFPKAAQLPEKIGGVPMSPLDYMVSLGSLGGAVASGSPSLALGAAAPFLRPGLRKMLASDFYQKHMTWNPLPPMAERPLPSPGVASKLLALQEEPLFSLAQLGEGQRKRRGLLGNGALTYGR